MPKTFAESVAALAIPFFLICGTALILFATYWMYLALGICLIVISVLVGILTYRK